MWIRDSFLALTILYGTTVCLSVWGYEELPVVKEDGRNTDPSAAYGFRASPERIVTEPATISSIPVTPQRREEKKPTYGKLASHAELPGEAARRAQDRRTGGSNQHGASKKRKSAQPGLRERAGPEKTLSSSRNERGIARVDPVSHDDEGVLNQAVAADSRAQSHGSKSLGGTGWVMLAVMLAGGGFFLRYRRRRAALTLLDLNASRAEQPFKSTEIVVSGVDEKAKLAKQLEPLFVDLRTASKSGDRAFIREHCTESVAANLIQKIGARHVTPVSAIKDVQAELVDLYEDAARYFAAVQYTAELDEGTSKRQVIRQIWHFVCGAPGGGDWKLAGIERI